MHTIQPPRRGYTHEISHCAECIRCKQPTHTHTHTAGPPEPWSTLTPQVVALFRYQAKCFAHECPGHLQNGPIHTSLPSELHPTLCAHLREHFSDGTALAPHRRPPEELWYLLPCTEPGAWFHARPALAIVAVDAGTTLADMARARVAEMGHHTQVASTVGTSSPTSDSSAPRFESTGWSWTPTCPWVLSKHTWRAATVGEGPHHQYPPWLTPEWETRTGPSSWRQICFFYYFFEPLVNDCPLWQ